MNCGATKKYKKAKNAKNLQIFSLPKSVGLGNRISLTEFNRA
jgi:hypothetical protein